MTLYKGYNVKDDKDPVPCRTCDKSYKSKTDKKAWEKSNTRERKGVVDQALKQQGIVEQARIVIPQTPHVRREVGVPSGDMRDLKDIVASAAKAAAANTDKIYLLTGRIRDALPPHKKENTRPRDNAAPISGGERGLAKADEAVKKCAELKEKSNIRERKGITDQASPHVRREVGAPSEDMRDLKDILASASKAAADNTHKIDLLTKRLEKSANKMQNLNTPNNVCRKLCFDGVRDVLSPHEKENARPCGNAAPVSGGERGLAKTIADEAVKKCAELNARKKRAQLE